MSSIARALPLVLLLTTVAPDARALNPERRISQYGHTAWRMRDGFFSSTAHAITQTPDGYLWIGTENGLIRFDGVRFVPWTPPAGQKLDNRIFSVLGTRDGSLWVSTGKGVSRVRNGSVTTIDISAGRAGAMVADREGTGVWIVRSRVSDEKGPLCHLTERGMECQGKNAGIPYASSAQLAGVADGSFWFGGRFGVSHWKAGKTTHHFEKELGSNEGLFGLTAVAAGPGGEVWIGMEPQVPGDPPLRHFDGKTWTTHDLPRMGQATVEVLSLFVDRHQALWIGTSTHGIFRMHGGVVDHFGMADGLSSEYAGEFFQDHEGNLWVLTSQGVDVFRELRVASYSVREGLTTDSVSSLVATPDGRVWLGNVGALDVIQGGSVSAVRPAQGLPGRTISSLFTDHAGALWVGVDEKLFVYEQGKFQPITRADGEPVGLVNVITEDVAHDLWVRAGPNFYRIRDRKIQETLAASATLPAAFSMAPDPKGGIWLGHRNGALARYRDGRVEHFPAPKGAEEGSVMGLIVDPDGSVWASVMKGLVRLAGKQRRVLTVRNGLPCEGFYALQDDDRGGLWLYGQCGLVSIARSELEKWWAQPDTVVKLTVLDLLDGVQPGMATFQPASSRTADGRLWFTNDRIVQMVDPARLEGNRIAPAVHIEQVVADRRAYEPRPGLRLPALTRDLEISYTALSFVHPQKVRFRYRLEGRDTGWQEPGTRRQAFYSDLPPGTYKFRVIACNNDGVWNEVGASLDLSIAAAWYQTRWFLALSVIAALLFAWMLYRLRLRKVARDMSARFDTRLAERTRIARELHDTLLQTIQASKLVAETMAVSGDPARVQKGAAQLSDWLGRAMREGREALNSLRTSTIQENDLAHAFRLAAEESLAEKSMGPASMTFSVSVTGTPRDLHPIVRDEIYRIGYEAIRNATAHSQGTRLQIELRYDKDLTLRIRDDGTGIPADLAESGRPGHFGLQGMRERASRIGATLTLTTTTGTDVTLLVPAAIVFRRR